MDQSAGSNSAASTLLSILADCSSDAIGSYQLPRLLSDSSATQDAVRGSFSSDGMTASSSWPLEEKLCGVSVHVLEKDSELRAQQLTMNAHKHFPEHRVASILSGSCLKKAIDTTSAAKTAGYGYMAFPKSETNQGVADTVRNTAGREDTMPNKAADRAGNAVLPNPSSFMQSAVQESDLLRQHSFPSCSIQAAAAAASVNCGVWRQNSSPADVPSHLSTKILGNGGDHAQKKRSRNNYEQQFALAPDSLDQKSDWQVFMDLAKGLLSEDTGEQEQPASEGPLPPNSVTCKFRAKRGCATHPRSIAERHRRSRISERIKNLQKVVPNMGKHRNIADMLDEAVEYVKRLQQKVQDLSQNCLD